MREFLAHKLATLHRDGRLTVTSRRHKLQWLPREEAELECVIERRTRGCLYITTLRLWAKRKGITEDQATADIAALQTDTQPPELPAIWLAKATRKPGAGNPLYRIQLPDLAIWALLRARDGPMQAGPSSRSTRVMIRAEREGIHVWSQRASSELFATGGLSVFE